MAWRELVVYCVSYPAIEIKSRIYNLVSAQDIPSLNFISLQSYGCGLE